ncbi:hypothetical protein HQ489_05600 [Candidatus Woesearchaeota archaeon]|nr:hypothetical protein [Candidatus Woesearchaeota archaeon]
MIHKTLTSLISGLGNRFIKPTSIIVGLLGISYGVVYVAHNNFYDSDQNVNGLEVHVRKRTNNFAKSEDCRITLSYPKLGELKEVTDYGCDKTIDEIKINGIHGMIEPSSFYFVIPEPINLAKTLIQKVNYQIK